MARRFDALNELGVATQTPQHMRLHCPTGQFVYPPREWRFPVKRHCSVFRAIVLVRPTCLASRRSPSRTSQDVAAVGLWVQKRTWKTAEHVMFFAIESHLPFMPTTVQHQWLNAFQWTFLPHGSLARSQCCIAKDKAKTLPITNAALAIMPWLLKKVCRELATNEKLLCFF